MWKAAGRWPVREWIRSSPKRSRSSAASAVARLSRYIRPGSEWLAAPVDRHDRRALAGQADGPDADAGARRLRAAGRHRPRPASAA